MGEILSEQPEVQINAMKYAVTVPVSAELVGHYDNFWEAMKENQRIWAAMTDEQRAAYNEEKRLEAEQRRLTDLASERQGWADTPMSKAEAVLEIRDMLGDDRDNAQGIALLEEIIRAIGESE